MSHNIAPLVSVFIPYYNDEQFLRQSIESVLNNTYQNFELILLNHATQDSCKQIAHSYNDVRIKHIDMTLNYGGGSGLLFEAMLSISKGKYIKPFCADDMLIKDGLQILVDYMENNPNKDFAFGDVEYINIKGKNLYDSWFKGKRHHLLHCDEKDCLLLLAKGSCPVPYPGAIIKKTVLQNILPMNISYIMMFDMSIWANLLCQGYKIGFIDKKVAYYRISKNQLSSVFNEKRVSALLKNESESFIHIFLSIKSVSLAKEVFSGWGNHNFDDIINDQQDLDFYIAYKFFIARKQIASYLLLDKMLNDRIKSKRIEEVFAYTIKEFRQDILVKNKSLKQNIFSKPVKNLTLFDLCFLMTRQILSIIKEFFKTFRQMIKKGIHFFKF